MSRGLIFTLACLAAACGDQDKAPRGDVVPNTFDEQLRDLSPSARNLGLRNAILDSGARCERVDRSAFQQPYKGTAMWLAHCTNTGDFAVFVGRTGYAQVVRCDAVAASDATCAWPEGGNS